MDRSTLQQLLAEKISSLSKGGYVPSDLIARNLEVAIRDEPLSEQLINQAFKPHWRTMWQLLAAGHWKQWRRQLELPGEKIWAATKAPHLPALAEGGVSVNLMFIDDKPKFQINLGFDGVLLWANEWPEIEELRHMLLLKPRGADLPYQPIWQGPYYSATRNSQNEKNLYHVRVFAAPIWLTIREPVWLALRRLVPKALTAGDLPQRIEALKMRCGSRF
jgi:hypothetical protein